MILPPVCTTVRRAFRLDSTMVDLQAFVSTSVARGSPQLHLCLQRCLKEIRSTQFQADCLRPPYLPEPKAHARLCRSRDRKGACETGKTEAIANGGRGASDERNINGCQECRRSPSCPRCPLSFTTMPPTPPSPASPTPLAAALFYDHPYPLNALGSPPRYELERSYSSAEPLVPRHDSTGSIPHGGTEMADSNSYPPPSYRERSSSLETLIHPRRWSVRIKVRVSSFFLKREKTLFWIMVVGASMVGLMGEKRVCARRGCSRIYIPS